MVAQKTQERKRKQTNAYYNNALNRFMIWFSQIPNTAAFTLPSERIVGRNKSIRRQPQSSFSICRNRKHHKTASIEGLFYREEIEDCYASTSHIGMHTRMNWYGFGHGRFTFTTVTRYSLRRNELMVIVILETNKVSLRERQWLNPKIEI